MASRPDDAPGAVPPSNREGHQPDVVPDKPLVPHDAYRPQPSDVDGDRPETFEFRFEPLLIPFAAVFGITPFTARVVVDADRLHVRFGPWALSTALDNVDGCEVTGPYSFAKVAGPAHLSFADGGITFATNRTRGLCVRLREAVPGLLPAGLPRHSALTVTVAGPEDLKRRLERG